MPLHGKALHGLPGMAVAIAMAKYGCCHCHGQVWQGSREARAGAKDKPKLLRLWSLHLAASHLLHKYSEMPKYGPVQIKQKAGSQSLLSP